MASLPSFATTAQEVPPRPRRRFILCPNQLETNLVTVKQDIRHHSQCSADLLVIFQSDYDSVHGLIFLGEHLLHEAHITQRLPYNGVSKRSRAYFGSTTLRTWFSCKPVVRTCFCPEGQSTSTPSTLAASPRPK
jgi:hypothetical protein